jgi:hypothetical protein
VSVPWELGLNSLSKVYFERLRTARCRSKSEESIIVSLWCKKIQNNKKISDENNVEEKSYPYLIFNKRNCYFCKLN